MNKPELIARIAQETGETQVKVRAIVDAFYLIIEDFFADGGDKVRLGNLGMLKAVDRQARHFRHPQTQELKENPAYRTVIFSASENLKDLVNEDADDLDS